MGTLREPCFGINTTNESSGSRITTIVPGGAAAAAGLLVGAQIVSVNVMVLPDFDAFAAFGTTFAGTSLTTFPAIIRRNGKELNVSIPLRLASRVNMSVVPLVNASAKSEQVLRGLTAKR